MATKRMTGLVVPSSAVREIGQTATVEVFQRLRFWDKLSKSEQSTVFEEGRQLAAAMMVSGMADLAQGQHLTEIHAVLNGKGYFQPFIRKFTRYPLKQAYRLMSGYKNAAERLSEPVLKAAMARNLRIFSDDPKRPLGVYTDAVRQLEGRTTGRLGPGANAEPEKVERWLNQVEEYTKERRSKLAKSGRKAKEAEESLPPEELLKRVYQTFVRAYRQLPSSRRSKDAFFEKLVGYQMKIHGLSSGARFEPMTPPDAIEPNPVGRPALESAQ